MKKVKLKGKSMRAIPLKNFKNTYQVEWRQVFEMKLQAIFVAPSPNAAVNRAKKVSREIENPKRIDVKILESRSLHMVSGDDYRVTAFLEKEV